MNGNESVPPERYWSGIWASVSPAGHGILIGCIWNRLRRELEADCSSPAVQIIICLISVCVCVTGHHCREHLLWAEVPPCDSDAGRGASAAHPLWPVVLQQWCRGGRHGDYYTQTHAYLNPHTLIFSNGPIKELSLGGVILEEASRYMIHNPKIQIHL